MKHQTWMAFVVLLLAFACVSGFMGTGYYLLISPPTGSTTIEFWGLSVKTGSVAVAMFALAIVPIWLLMRPAWTYIMRAEVLSISQSEIERRTYLIIISDMLSTVIQEIGTKASEFKEEEHCHRFLDKYRNVLVALSARISRVAEMNWLLEAAPRYGGSLKNMSAGLKVAAADVAGLAKALKSTKKPNFTKNKEGVNQIKDQFRAIGEKLTEIGERLSELRFHAIKDVHPDDGPKS
jgi:hypothetical protein